MSEEKWMGIGKLTEEAGELLQVLGKLIPFPEGDHPDGKNNLVLRLEEEIADLHAALQYFVVHNKLNEQKIIKRWNEKYHLFNSWVLTGLK